MQSARQLPRARKPKRAFPRPPLLRLADGVLRVRAQARGLPVLAHQVGAPAVAVSEAGKAGLLSSDCGQAINQLILKGK